MKKWNELPAKIRNEQTLDYYVKIKKKYVYFFLKRIFDILFSVILLILLLPVILIVSLLIKLDTEGPILYKQIRVTRYSQEFYIYKFRTMSINHKDEEIQITVGNDLRITRMGKLIRSSRLDELPQLINILKGDMSFVGTRPEVPRYVEFYSPEMQSTLLIRAGVTSLASIEYKDEAMILDNSLDPEKEYITKILPEKMEINLSELKQMSIVYDIKLLILTIIRVLK